MAGSRPPADLARWLIDAGAGASAITVLEGVRGGLANDLRLEAARSVLRPGIYAAVTLPEGRGAVLPVEVAIGASRSVDGAFREATDRACRLARARFPERSLPSLRVKFEEGVDISGASIGLAAAVAFLGVYYGMPSLRAPIVITGALNESGHAVPVSGMKAKLRAAGAERGVGAVLVPLEAGLEVRDGVRAVSTLSEALAIVYGDLPRTPARRFLELDALRAYAEQLPHVEAIEALSAALEAASYPADVLAIQAQIAAHYRHLGRTGEAAAIAALAQQRALDLGPRRLGIQVAETVALHHWLGRLAEFDVDTAIAGLAEGVRRGLSAPLHEIRWNGALAQAFAIAGRTAEAYATRLPNRELHALAEDAARVEPGTHAILAVDAARLGLEDAFDRHVDDMVRSTAPGDERQARYDVYAWVRGSIMLGRMARVCSYADGCEVPGFSLRAAAVEHALNGGPIREHPETTTMRAVARALWETGRHERAEALLLRIEKTDAAGLGPFLAQLSQLELALLENSRGQTAQAATRWADTVCLLRQTHPAAAAHWLSDAEGVEARVVDCIWY